MTNREIIVEKSLQWGINEFSGLNISDNEINSMSGETVWDSLKINPKNKHIYLTDVWSNAKSFKDFNREQQDKILNQLKELYP